MRNDDHWDLDRSNERDNEREPTRARRRPHAQLTSAGTLRRTHEDAARSDEALALLRKVGAL